MKILKAIFSLIKETVNGFSQANGTLLAAALAYYSIFSLAPLLVIAVSVAGAVFGKAAVTGILVEQISEIVSPELAITIQNAIENIYLTPSSDLTTVISLTIMLVGASIMFVQLKRAINFLWGIVPQEGKGFILVIQTQFLSFLIVMMIGLLSLAAMAIGTIMVFVGQIMHIMPATLQQNLPRVNFGMMFLLFSVLFAIIFKTLPDARIAWKDTLLGAAVTSVLFTIGEFLIGIYLGYANLGSAYGAASSVIVLLIWIYYSMQIILFGAKFTQVYANTYGSGILPAKRADLVIQQRLNNNDE